MAKILNAIFSDIFTMTMLLGISREMIGKVGFAVTLIKTDTEKSK